MTANEHHASTHGQPIPGRQCPCRAGGWSAMSVTAAVPQEEPLSTHSVQLGFSSPSWNSAASHRIPGLQDSTTGRSPSEEARCSWPALEGDDRTLLPPYPRQRGHVGDSKAAQPRAHLTPSLDRSWLVGELKAEAVQVGTGSDIQEVPGEVNVPPAFCLGHTHTPPPPPQLAAADSKSS